MREQAARTLTPVEARILSLISAGYTDIQIALELRRSVNTVRTHVGNINRKFHAHTRAQSVAIAIRRGLIE